MKVLSPVGDLVSTDFVARDRPRSLDGLRIGLLDNTKAPVDIMLKHLEQRLRERIPGAHTVYMAKQVMSRAAETDVMASLQQNTDVLITALAD